MALALVRMLSKSGLSPLSGHWTGRGLASQLRSEKHFEDHETQRVSEVGKLLIVSITEYCVLSWWKRWPRLIQTRVLMCKYGNVCSVFTVKGILWRERLLHYCCNPVFRNIQSRRDWKWGERCVLLIHVNKRNTKQIFTPLNVQGE